MADNPTSQFISSSGNHLQPGYGKESKNIKSQLEDVWNFKMGGCRRPTIEFRTELQMSAHEIYSAFKVKEIEIFVDGSYSSQIMAHAFKWAGVKIKALIPRFIGDLNVHTVSQAVVLLENMEVPYQFVNLDIDQFLKSKEALDWGAKYRTDQVGQLVAMKIWEDRAKDNAVVVFPFGLPLIERRPEGWSVLEYENLYGLHRFQIDRQLLGVGYFFKWNPEVMVAFLNDPLMRKIVMNLYPTQNISPIIFKEIMRSYFPLLGASDHSGFEKIIFLLKAFFKSLQEQTTSNYNAYVFTYADLMSRLSYQPNVNGKASSSSASASSVIKNPSATSGSE